MDKQTPASDLERRKQVRLRLRGDLEIDPQKFEGRTYFVVKDPVSLRYYRFKEQEHFLLQFMDGRKTLDDAQKQYEVRFRPERLTLEDLESFAQQLLTAGLAQNESPRAGTQLYDRRKKRLRREWMQTLTNILYIKIPIFDPDRLLGWMLGYLWWIFTTWFLLLSVAFMLGVLIFVGLKFETFYERWPSIRELLTFRNIAIMWVSLGIVKVIHEFGHGLSCKAFGGEVHEMGALFLCFSPCLYANVSDAWTLPNKWHRILISFAGIYVELMIAAIAGIVWWNTFSHPLANAVAQNVMVMCTISTIWFNGNPLMRYDGYYILADLLEIPNLRDRSNRYLKNVVLEHCLGVEVQPEPYMALWRRMLFVGYAVVSWVYRWVVTFTILTFMATFLKPYKLEVISNFLAVAAACSLFGWPLFNLGKNLHKRGRLPDMKRARVLISASAVAAVVLFFFLVPLPMTSRVRQKAVILPRPDAVEKVYLAVPYPCILEELRVRDGETVEEGQDLARFSSRELDEQLQEAEAQYTIRAARIHALERVIATTFDASEQEKARVELAGAVSERDRYQHEIELHQRLADELVLKAPRAGVVMSPPKVDEVGKLWDKEIGAPFCGIGNPTRLRAVVPLEPDEYRVLVDDLNEKKAHGDHLDVTLRVTGRDTATWQGELSILPQSEAKEIPPHLTDKVGGPIAVVASGRPDHFVPRSQQYLASVDFVSHDDLGAVCPGAMAQVKVHCRWRTCAWRVWQAVNKSFDLKLWW